ncbi:hypothetical protein GCM10009127_23370 [Alteraurantiacibacter aestuarii]
MYAISLKAIARSVAAAGASLALCGCFLSPGSFEAAMDIRKDGDFTFSYDGEIFIMAMSDLAEMADQAEAQEPCIDEDTLVERPCTAKELDARQGEQAQERAMMQAMLGGMDLSDPDAAAQFAARLERQHGWNQVTYLGDGLFDVDFTIRSRLTHDFSFPSIEGFPMANDFVSANLRDDDRVRIEATGFAAQAGSPLQAMLSGMAGAFPTGDNSGPSAQSASIPAMPPMQGSFRLTTNAQILTNNTDEGPQSAGSGSGQLLEWNIAPGNTIAPTVMLQLEP